MALTPPAPTPVATFARGIVHWIDDTYLEPYRDFYEWVSGTSLRGDLAWRYVVVKWTRSTPTGTVEDDCQFGFHLMNITNGDLDTSWTTTDYQQVEANLDEFCSRLQPIVSTSHRVKEYRWYIRQFNDELPVGSPVTTLDPATGKPYARFANTGPAIRVTPKSLVGSSATTALPYQVALSVTLKTPTPKHWGRIYIPGMVAGGMDLLGRFNSTTVVKSVADGTAELIDDCAKQDFQVVVPSTQAASQFHVALQQVSAVQVDDIPDVIRRRRARVPVYRTPGVALP